MKKEHGHYSGKYLKSVVYGGVDGTITTFAIVAGVAGASLSSNIVLILGFANLIADGFSMAVSDYLSSRAEKDYKKMEKTHEEKDIKNNPKKQKEILKLMYVQKGVNKRDASSLSNIISKYKNLWSDTLIAEEIGIVERNPVKSGLVTFASFALFGFIPLLTFVLAKLFPGIYDNSFLIASILTGVTFFILGSCKCKVTNKNWLKGGLETLVVGGLAAGAAYFVGSLLAGLV